jgi:hypothetical protein
VSAQQLRDRLNAVFSDAPQQEVQRRHAEWPGGIGARVPDVRTIVVHETSGWPSRVNGQNMFYDHFLADPGAKHDGITSQMYVSGDGTVELGMDLPIATSHARPLNSSSIGVETGHSWGNYDPDGRLGPYTSTGANGGRTALTRRAGNEWTPLAGDTTIESAADDDLPGVKLWVRERVFGEVVVGMWTTERYDGPWRQPLRVPEMVFREETYRSWALLARWLAEEFLIPRNFPLLPHKTRTPGAGDPGAHGMLTDAASFSAIVLADDGLARSPRAFDPHAGPDIPTEAALQALYGHVQVVTPKFSRNNAWTQVFSVLRGFHGHGYSGDSVQGKDHDCPGPMFDWQRFAREVWDWWWWPFDFDAAHPNDAVAARKYSLRDRDGDTPLKEYFFSTAAAVPQGRARDGVHGAHGSPQTFELPQSSRVYALANGTLVAARFPAENDQLSMAFMLVRHEVFHTLDTRAPAANAVPPIFAERIDYNVAPTSFYSLYMHLGRPAGMSFDDIVDANPDWLNRLLARKIEAKLGVDFRASGAGLAIANAAWNNRPPGSEHRPTLIEGWTADNTALTAFMNTLKAGHVAVPSADADTLPINILLGDFLASAGIISRVGAVTRRGVRVEVFANTLVSNTDFMLTDTTATTHNWTPNVGVGSPVVRYASEWARTPTAAEAAALQAVGVNPALVNWWLDVQPATLNARVPIDAALDANGIVHHYDPMTFLPWINRRTWRSEWPKYRVTDPTGIPAAPRPR